MVHARDCFDVDFYLGEVLVTTAEVECFGIRGHAKIMGDKPMMAVLAATVNALMRSRKAEISDELSQYLEIYLQRYRDLQQQESLLTAATKVNFESMSEEN
jgi:phosphonate C-P lyase system protein PhnG